MSEEVEKLRQRADQERLVAVVGPNFSGRTGLLRRVVGLGDVVGSPAADWTGGLYLGQDVASFFSGIAQSAADELRLHGDYVAAGSPFDVGAVRLGALAERNPFTLSGGEQVVLALACAGLCEPEVLAVDGSLEQLSGATKSKVVGWLTKRCGVVMTDNRLLEWATDVGTVRAPGPSGGEGGVPPIDGGALDGIEPSGGCRLELKGMTFRYGRGPLVLAGIDYAFEPGRVYCLQGENGAGKSTLARLLVGELTPSGGEVLINGARTHLFRRPAEVVAYHFQNPDLQLFATTVRRELTAGLRAARAGADVLVGVGRAFGLLPFLDEHPQELPYVLRKRVALAATFAMQRPWLVLDEPTLGQDDAALESIARLVRSVAAGGTGVVVITHSVTFREALGGIDVYLHGGHLRSE